MHPRIAMHRPLRILLVAWLCVLAFSASATAAPRTRPTVPPDWGDFSLYAAGPTIRSLINQTKPTLVTTEDEPFFVWIHPYKAAFSFTVAQASRLPSGQWCLLSGGDGWDTMTHFPRTTHHPRRGALVHPPSRLVHHRGRHAPEVWLPLPTEHRPPVGLHARRAPALPAAQSRGRVALCWARVRSRRG